MTQSIERLTDFIDFKNGKAVQLLADGEIPVFGSNGIVGTTGEPMAEDAVVLGRVGAHCGAAHFGKGPFWPTDNTIVAKPKYGHSIRYLYYLLKNTPLREYAGGAAQPLITKQILSGVRVRVHDRIQAARVADILSAYDDLIENNRRRIALLEEEARLLYREWFVHFRFPGHEHVGIVDDLPEGWERRTFRQIAELKYGKALKQENRIEGPFPVYGSSGIVGSHQAALAEGPAIVVGRKGNVGSVYWSPVNFWPIDTVYFIPKEQIDFWLYLALPSAGFQNTDAGVPGLNRDFAYSRKLTSPPVRLRRLFNEAVEPMFSQRTTLENYNQKLAQARDLLLPRLMNGEIAV